MQRISAQTGSNYLLIHDEHVGSSSCHRTGKETGGKWAGTWCRERDGNEMDVFGIGSIHPCTTDTYRLPPLHHGHLPTPTLAPLNHNVDRGCRLFWSGSHGDVPFARCRPIRSRLLSKSDLTLDQGCNPKAPSVFWIRVCDPNPSWPCFGSGCDPKAFRTTVATLIGYFLRLAICLNQGRKGKDAQTVQISQESRPSFPRLLRKASSDCPEHLGR